MSKVINSKTQRVFRKCVWFLQLEKPPEHYCSPHAPGVPRRLPLLDVAKQRYNLSFWEVLGRPPFHTSRKASPSISQVPATWKETGVPRGLVPSPPLGSLRGRGLGARRRKPLSNRHRRNVRRPRQPPARTHVRNIFLQRVCLTSQLSVKVRERTLLVSQVTRVNDT